MAKNKSFLHSFAWVGALLLGMGLLFAFIALVIQLTPMAAESINVYRNGVRQVSTEATVRQFKLIFLLTFGLIGLCLCAGGAVVLLRIQKRRRLARQLMEDGLCVTADMVDFGTSNVSLNHRTLLKLRCSYTAPDGRTYVFQSGHLRMDPSPFLRDGQVKVYCDRDDIRRYYVDVDGSVASGAEVIEL